MADYSKLTKKELIMTLYARDLMLENERKRLEHLVEAEFNRKWANKYVEMRRKEDPMLCLPDSDEVYEKYFELKQQLHDLPKKIIEDVKEFCENWKDYDEHYNPTIMLVENSGIRTQPTLYEELNTILKKYGGENESK